MISKEMSTRWVRSGRGVRTCLLKELQHKRCHTEDEWEENKRYYAYYSDGWYELISHIHNHNWYYEWEEPKCDESEWEWDDSEYCSEDEIYYSENDSEEECWYVSIAEGDTSDRVHVYKKVDSGGGDEKVYDVAHI